MHFYGDFNEGPFDPSAIGALTVEWQRGFEIVTDDQCNPTNYTAAVVRVSNAGGNPLTLLAVQHTPSWATINGLGVGGVLRYQQVPDLSALALPLVIGPGLFEDVRVQLQSVSGKFEIDDGDRLRSFFLSSAGAVVSAPPFPEASDDAAVARAKKNCGGVQPLGLHLGETDYTKRLGDAMASVTAFGGAGVSRSGTPRGSNEVAPVDITKPGGIPLKGAYDVEKSASPGPRTAADRPSGTEAGRSVEAPDTREAADYMVQQISGKPSADCS